MLSVLSAPNQVQGLKALAAASRLFCDHYQDFKTPKEGADEWAMASHVEVEISESQRDVIKGVLTSCAEAKLISPGKYSLELISAFGLIE